MAVENVRFSKRSFIDDGLPLFLWWGHVNGTFHVRTNRTQHLWRSRTRVSVCDHTATHAPSVLTLSIICSAVRGVVCSVKWE